jgi:hypothetical protein
MIHIYSDLNILTYFCPFFGSRNVADKSAKDHLKEDLKYNTYLLLYLLNLIGRRGQNRPLSGRFL